ncbi:MAG: amino acid ABC transporter substrate-binding protein [Treponema sp.]|nr:amino acid ABC transporter substrate-binding protein [Treponema sp.]
MEKIGKIVSAVLFAVVAVSSLASCAKKSSVDNSLEDLKSRGKFVLGLDDSFPPLGFRDENNEIVGYDIDMAAEVAKRMGVPLVLQPIDWAAKEQELATGKIDCIWNGFTMTKERREAMACTFAYLDNAQVAVVRNESGVKNLSDLKNKNVGVQSGSSAWEAITADSDFMNSLGSVVEFEENLTALNDLGIGNIDAVVMDRVVAEYTIKHSGQPYRVLKEGLANEEYGIAFRKQDIKLRDEVERILLEMQNDGTVKSISEKWFGEDLSVIGR